MCDIMTRSGTVILLGAGASRDAAYPLASDILEPFLEAVEEASQRDVEIRKMAEEYILKHGGSAETIPKGGQTILEWFQTKWEEFEDVASKVRPLALPEFLADGRPNMPSQVIRDTPSGFSAFTPYPAFVEGETPLSKPYLETFFAFYDGYMRPIIFAMKEDQDKLRTIQWRFRELREIAIKTVYRELSAYERPPAYYLTPLLELEGPKQYGCSIATLNHDVTVEQIASTLKIELDDGFDTKSAEISPMPPEWNDQELENLQKLWVSTSKNCHKFIGFRDTPENEHLLLKLHGSLGWFVLEQGVGEIGYRDALRYNTAYKYFRLPYEIFWSPENRDIIDQIATGGDNDPVTRTETGSLSRKAGVVFVRPYLIFARAVKSHPDSLFISLINTFTNLLEKARNILVIGYSWADPHVNDIILDAVARGATLINLSKSAIHKPALALWTHRFPTTFHFLNKRLFMFGGGARQVLEEGIIELPSGESKTLDFTKKVQHGLPIELSLKHTLS